MRMLVSLLVLLMLFACSENPFPPQSLVERLRVLAVRADPPETDPFGTVELTALVADPQGQGRALQFSWAVCLLEFGTEASDIECPGPDSYPLPGEGPRTTLSLPDLLAWLVEKGIDLEQMDELPEDMRPAEIPLYVGFEVTAGGLRPETTRAVKRVTVRIESQEEPNQNPVLEGLLVNGVAVTDDPMQIGSHPKVTLTPVADENTRQTYLRQGEQEERLEDFLFAWYSTAGEFKSRRTILEVDNRGNRLDENEWDLPGQAGPVTLWLVVRDGRYGTDWLELRFEIAP